MKKNLSLIGIFLILTGSTMPSFAAFIIHPSNGVEQPVNPDATSVSSALHDFMSLSRKERRERMREVKSEIKEFKAEKRAGSEPSTNQLLLVILAIILPPLAVYLHEGVINGKFWLDLVLTLLFFIPGIIYALIVVLGKS
ncbi:MAG TPA: YqaE/Pmp3 family membrane protein [Chitinophagaceae bacterium]